jgi:hypothetical protein
MTYVVTAGFVSAETQVTKAGGRAVLDFPRGAVLPDDVPDEQLQGFLRGGLVEDVDGAPEPEPEPEPEPDEVDLSELDKDALLAYADEHKLAVDKRLGEDKLRAAIQEAQEAE